MIYITSISDTENNFKIHQWSGNVSPYRGSKKVRCWSEV